LFFTKVLEFYRAALGPLKLFGHDVLKVDLKKHVVCAEAQSCAHSLCFIAGRGSCAEMVGALAINIPVRNLVSKRLRNDLIKYGGYNEKQLAFLDLEATSIPDFDGLAEKALNEALRLVGTSWRKIESSTKILQESEKLFWDCVLREVTEVEVSRRMQRVSFWESFKVNDAPMVPHVPHDFDIPRPKKLKRAGTVKNISVNSSKRVKRKTSLPLIPSTFAQMNDSQEMKKIPRTFSTKHGHRVNWQAPQTSASKSKIREFSDVIEITENTQKSKNVFGTEGSVSADQKMNEDCDIKNPSGDKLEGDEKCN